MARIVANRERMRAGRTTAVALVYRTAYGGHVAVAAGIILKELGPASRRHWTRRG